MRRFPLLELLARRQAERRNGPPGADDRAALSPRGQDAQFALPPGWRIEHDLAYGGDPAQRLDVYRPADARSAPLMLFVHGGGWRQGDKSMRRMVEHKMRFWLARGWVFVSMNYRLLPLADPLQQALDLGHALAFVQANAPRWHADPARIVLLGHSAGAHLAALLTADAGLRADTGVQPWPGSVLLDTAALDVVSIMQRPHFRLYDAAFGSDPDFWSAASPLHRMSAQPEAAMLLVVSSLREDSEPAALAFAARARALGGRAELLSLPLTHRQLNDELGQPGVYTDSVEAFVHALTAR